MNDLSGLVAFRPEVHAIDISVGEPKAFVMRVVLRLSSNTRDHRVAAGNNRSGGCAKRKEDGLVVPFKIVGRERLTFDRDLHLARFLLEAHPLGLCGLVCLGSPRKGADWRLNEQKAMANRISSILLITVSLKISIDDNLFGPPKRTGFRLALRLAGMTVVLCVIWKRRLRPRAARLDRSLALRTTCSTATTPFAQTEKAPAP